MSAKKVRVRFAPSPTGYLHVGGARTALYNYLYAKNQGGTFILRIEDTDLARSTDESLHMVLDDLTWLGLNWEEGPDSKTLADIGKFGPYRQSQRKSIYTEVAHEILNKGLAYYCFLTDEEIEEQRQAAQAQGKPPHVNSPYQDWTLAQAQEKISQGGKPVVRFKTKNLKKDYLIKDAVRGDVRFPSDMVGDFVLLRSDGMPVYNFCCAVDDHLMEITHVIRAEEHLSNTLRQLMIYEALNWEIPCFGHVSIILDEDRQKLSKRKGATSCNQFKDEGYLPQALKNFVLLLGWSHPEGKEILTQQEMEDSFSLERLNASGAVFDSVKLKWMNATYLRALPNQELWQETKPFLDKAGLNLPEDKAWQDKSLEVFKSSMETLADAVELYKPTDDNFFQIHDEASETLQWESTKKVLLTWKESLSQINTEYLTAEEFLTIQKEVEVNAAVKGKNLFMPIRVAIIGKPHGAELKILVPLIKKSSLINRADIALAKIN
ncbi:MAG: glutamate--tRNA ligase [Proteobacteria bacterium]|nr:glutamate--tRNA ligase [Pseudomonadota bacterium]